MCVDSIVDNRSLRAGFQGAILALIFASMALDRPPVGAYAWDSGDAERAAARRGQAMADPDQNSAAAAEGDIDPGKPLLGLPFAAAIGVRAHRIGDGEAVLSIGYDPRLVGDPVTGVIHGGVVTSLLDTCGGVAVMHSPTKPRSVATLDLRIDYMRPAAPERRIYAEARCFRETRLITFVRAVAYHDDPDQPIATAIGAFMADGRALPPKSAAEEGA